jgi:hypothetical protein
MTATLVAVAVIVTAAAATAAAIQIFRRRDATEFDGLADVFLDEVLELVHFFLRVEEAAGDGIFEKRVAVFFKRGDFRRFQRLTTVLFFLKRLAFAHQAFVSAARRGVGQERIQALLDAAGLDVFDDSFAEFARFGFDFV